MYGVDILSSVKSIWFDVAIFTLQISAKKNFYIFYIIYIFYIWKDYISIFGYIEQLMVSMKVNNILRRE